MGAKATPSVGTVGYLGSAPATAVLGLASGAVLLVLGVIYLAQGHHSAAPIDTHHILPVWSGLASIVLVVNSFLTHAGVEVNAVPRRCT